MSASGRQGPAPAPDEDITRVIGTPRAPSAAPLPAAFPRPLDDDPEKTIVKAPSVPQARTVPVPPPAALRPFKPKTGTALALPPGFRLHEYRIDRVLGQGGF